MTSIVSITQIFAFVVALLLTAAAAVTAFMTKPDAKFPALVEKAKTFLNGHPAGGVNGAVIPFCPPELFPAGDPERWRLKSTAGTEGTPTDFVGRRTWATKGAANAGVAVFLYVDQLVKSGIKPQPEYNHCQDLSP